MSPERMLIGQRPMPRNYEKCARCGGYGYVEWTRRSRSASRMEIVTEPCPDCAVPQ